MQGNEYRVRFRREYASAIWARYMANRFIMMGECDVTAMEKSNGRWVVTGYTLDGLPRLLRRQADGGKA